MVGTPAEPRQPRAAIDLIGLGAADRGHQLLVLATSERLGESSIGRDQSAFFHLCQCYAEGVVDCAAKSRAQA